MDKIGKYKVLGKIGEGAMGVVYKALDPRIDRILAVKTMSADLDSEPELRHRFEREARSAGKLSHKNIITIYDLFEEGGRIFIAMEFLDGEELKIKIARRERMSLEYKLQVMTELCEGLAHAHHEEIVHRDVKPGNIHITRNGHVKILDFGLARIASSDITKSGSVMGTPNYMSPEQITGDKVDNRADIFSAGAVFYELLTYRKPFPGTSFHQTFYKILHQDPTPPHEVIPALPKELSKFVLRALAKDPVQRYQRIDELIRDLSRFWRTLEERTLEIQEEARTAIAELEKFVGANKEALARQILLKGADDTVPGLLAEPGVREEQEEDATLQMDVTTGYLEMVEKRDQALRERKRLAALLDSLEKASSTVASARALWKGDQPEDALRLVEKLLQEVPQHAEAAELAEQLREELAHRAREEEKKQQVVQLVQQAQSHYRRGDFPESLAAIQRALTLEPDHVEATALRRKIDARLEEQRVEKERAEKAERLYRKAAAKFAAGDPAGSLPLLAEVFKLEPDHLEATALQENAQRQIKEIAEAEEERRQKEEALAGARAAVEADDLDKAREEWRRAQSLDADAPDVAEVEQLIDRARERIRAREERERRIHSLLDDVRALEARGSEEDALRRLAELLSLEPRHGEAAGLKSTIEARREDRKQAEQQRREEIAATLAEAKKAAKAGELEETVELTQSILSRESSHLDARRLLEQAEDQIAARKAREAAEKNAEELIARAKTEASRKNFPAAVSALEAADPAVKRLESVQKALQEHREAARRHEEAIARAQQVEEHWTSGKKAFEKGDYAGCEKDMGQVLALDSHHPEALALQKEAQRKLEARWAEERRARAFGEAMRAARKAFAAGSLDLAETEIEKARALDRKSKECRHLGEEIKQRQAEIEKTRQRRERAKELETKARRLLQAGHASQAAAALDEAVSLWSELPGASKLAKRIHKEVARAEKKVQQEARYSSRQLAADSTIRPVATRLPGGSKPVLAAAGLGVTIFAGVIWLVFLRQPAEQIASPDTAGVSDAALSEPDAETTRALAAARTFTEQKDFAAAVREAEGVLARAPGNTEAEQILASARSSLAAITSGIEEVQELVDAGEMAKARDSLGQVLALAPSNADVQALLARLNEFFKQEADEAAQQLNEAKSQAEEMDAAQLAPELFGSAADLESEAARLYGEGKFGEATGKFVEAGDVYRRAGAAAQEHQVQQARAEQERRLAAQREEATSARDAFQRARDEATQVAAETLAADDFRQALVLADQAQAKYGRGDFDGARRDFETARDGMNRSVEVAGAAGRASSERLAAARQAMETAKSRAAGDPQGGAQESRARALEEQGNLAEAEAAYREAASLYQAAAGSGEVARREILALLERYEAALEHRNLDELRAVWPTVSEAAYRQTFEFARSWAVELQIVDLQVSGDTAVVMCRRRDEMQTVDGQTHSPETNITFTIAKSAGTWIIQQSQEAR